MTATQSDSSSRNALQEAEERLRLIIEYTPVALAMFDREMRYLAVSRRWIDDYLPSGTTPLGLCHYDVCPDCPERWKEAHRRGLAGETITQREETWVRRDGTRQWARCDIRPWHASDGSIGGIVIFVENTTDRQLTELARQTSDDRLHERVEELEKLLDLIPIPVWIASDASCRHVRGNNSASTVLGTLRESNLSQDPQCTDTKHMRHFRHGVEIPVEALPMQRAGTTGIPQWEHELEVEREDGSRVVLSGGASPLFDREGRVRGVVAAMLDITQCHRLHTQLRETHERLQAVLDASADAILTVTRNGIIQTVNRAACRIFGYGRSELEGASLAKLMPEPYRSEHAQYLERFFHTAHSPSGEFRREVTGLRRDGTTFPAELAVTDIPELQVFTGIVRDITARRALERQISETAVREQQRIGRDLHDSVCQELFGLKLLVSSFAARNRLEPEVIEQLNGGLNRAHSELRAIMHGLMPVAVAPGGLMSALQGLADRISEEQAFECTFVCPHPVSLSDSFAATQLYLIAQEAVHNAVKHAQPRTIRVSLDQENAIRLLIEDDGIGIARSQSESGAGGLQIMRHRAELLGAILSVTDAVPHGTVVRCTLPGPTV